MAIRTSSYASGVEGLIIKHLADFWLPEFYQKLLFNIKIVLESFWQSGGIPFIGIFSVIMLYLYKIKRKPLIYWSIPFVIFYFVITTLFYVPLGSEEQHRYYLKLYPFFFMYINCFYTATTSKAWKTALLTCIAIALIIQYKLVEKNFTDARVAGERFKNLLTDTQYNFSGYIHGFYGNYTLAYTLLCIASVIAISKEIKEIKIK